jgi:hypothetical protein
LLQGYATASVTNGLATTNYVQTATNGFVTAAITNGLATTNYVRTATNGFVTAAITNGLATTNFVLSQGYATAVVTNGLATTNYVRTATNGFVTASVTNGMATTNFVLGQSFATASVTNGLATTNYVRTATNGFVTAAITNGLATTNFVLGQGFVTANVTNGLATTNYVSAQVPLALANFVAAPVTLPTNLTVGGNAIVARSLTAQGPVTNNSTVFLPTNTASFSFPSLTIKADAVLHTNFNQRAQLVGSVLLANSTLGDASISVLIRQGAVTNTFPIILGRASVAITNVIPFNFPLNPNAVWYFTNLSGAGTTAYVTNAVVVGQ